MTDIEPFEGFRALIADTFGAKPCEITRETTAADVNGWDSVSHASLIMAVESAYGIQFPDAEIFEFNDVGALFDRTMQLHEATA